MWLGLGARFFKGFIGFFLITSAAIAADLQDVRIDIIHIANLKGSYERLMPLVGLRPPSDTEPLWLVGGDVMGRSPYWEVDGNGKTFVEILEKLLKSRPAVLSLGRTDVYQPDEVLQRHLQSLARAGISVVATNRPQKGLVERSTVHKSGKVRVGVLNVLAHRPEAGTSRHALEDLDVIQKELQALAKKSDVIVLVTEHDLSRQRMLVEAMSAWPEFEKVVGVLGNDPKEKSLEYVRAKGRRVFLHQTTSVSSDVAQISISWKPDGERVERVQYFPGAVLSKKSIKVLQDLDASLGQKFKRVLGELDGELRGFLCREDLHAGTNPLGRLVANAFRDQGVTGETLGVPVVGVFRGTDFRAKLSKGKLTEADLVKVLHLNVGLEVLEVDGATLEALIRQDEANRASKARPSLQWSDNLRVTQRGGISVNRRKIDPAGRYLIVADALLVGGTAADGRPMMASGRGQSFFGAKKFKRVTTKVQGVRSEREAVLKHIQTDLGSKVRSGSLGGLSADAKRDEGLPKVRADALRFMPLEVHEIQRISSHPWSVVWSSYFPDSEAFSEVLVVDRSGAQIVGVVSLVRSKYGKRDDVLKDFSNMISLVWDEKNAGPKDPEPHFGILVKEFKPFSKPIPLSKITELFDLKQFTLRNRAPAELIDWLKKKGYVVERERDLAAESRAAIKLFEENAELEKVQAVASADAAIMGVYHSVAIPHRKPRVYKLTGTQLKKFFKDNPRRQFVTHGLQFKANGELKGINGKKIEDRKVYSIASLYGEDSKKFVEAFESGGKLYSGNALRAQAVQRALEQIRELVGVSGDDDEVRMEPIRERTKDLKAELWPHGLQIFPNGEFVETGGEVDQIPEDLLFERAFQRIFELLNPAQETTIAMSQKAISLMAQIEVVSRLTEDSLKVVREKTQIVHSLLKELESLPENVRDVFENPIIMGLIQTGYRPTVEEASILQKLYAGKPEDYHSLIKAFIEDPDLRDLFADKLRVIPPSFYNSPSSTTGAHHSKDQFFPNGQMEHDKSVLVLIQQLLKSKGFSQPLIEGVLYGMAAHDGWSHELSSINAFFTQFGIAGSRAILKGYLDYLILYYPQFEEFLKGHPRFRPEDLQLMAEQHQVMKQKMKGKIQSSNLRSNIKRMMLSSPLLGFSDLSPNQETWFVKNLAAYILFIHAAPEINSRVQEQLKAGAAQLSVRDIVRQVIDEMFGKKDPKTREVVGGLDGVRSEQRREAAKERSAFTERGARWIEDKLIYYVAVNTFGPLFDKRLDAGSVFISRDMLVRQVVPQLPDDEFQIISRVLSAAPSFKQPYGQELGRGSWAIEHPYKLLAQMVHITKVHAQKIRQSGREQEFLKRYADWGADIENILLNMHFIAAGHMGAYQLRSEVIYRILSSDGVPQDMLKKFLSTWFWSDNDGFVYDEKNPFHRAGLTANQADTLEALGYITIPKAGMNLPSKFKLRLKREVSFVPKDGFAELDKNRGSSRGRTASDFIRSPGDSISSVEFKRHYAKVTIWDHRGKNVTDDVRLKDLVHDLIHHVPGEFDGIFAINPPALHQKKLQRLALQKKKRERQRQEQDQDRRVEARAQSFATTIEVLRSQDPEALQDLEVEFGISEAEIDRMLASTDPEEWRSFLKDRAKLISRLQNISSARRAAYKVIPASQLSAEELKLRISEDRISEVRANDMQAFQIEVEGRQERNAQKESAYLEKVLDFLANAPKKWSFLHSWSHDALIGFQLAREYLGEEAVWKAIQEWGASAVVFETLYGGSFSMPFDGQERFEAFEGLCLFVMDLSDGRGDSARSVIFALGRDSVKVQNYFRWIREGTRAGVRGLKKIASDAGKGSSYVLGNYAQLEIAMVGRHLESRGFKSGSVGLENIAGFEVPVMSGTRLRVVDLLLKTGESIEIKNYSPESYLEFLPQILSQFEADVRLHKKDIQKMYWVFRGVEVDFRGTLEKFKEILRKEGFKEKAIKKFIEKNLIFLGLSGSYERYRNTGMSEARLQAAQLLNEKYYKDHKILESSPVDEALDLPKTVFKNELLLNWAGPNQEGVDFGKEMIGLLKKAKKSVHLVMYDLEDEGIVNELISAAKRLGPDRVQIVLEGSNYRDLPWKTVDEVNAWLKTLPLDEQRDFLFENADGAQSLQPEHFERLQLRVSSRHKQLGRLRRAKIKPVLIPKRKMAIMHIKYLTVDSTEALVTSANATTSDIYGDFVGNKKMAEANVNFMLRFTEKEIIGNLDQEFALLHEGWATKTSRESWPQARTFTDKTGASWTIGFAPFAGSGDVADMLQKSLEGIRLKSIYAQQFVFSDSKLAGILQKQIAAGAKRHMIFDDHFSTEPYSKAPFFMGLLARDFRGDLQSDRGTGQALTPMGLQKDEVVATWNGRVDETKNLEAKMHMKFLAGQGVDAKGKPIYWLVFGSGNSSFAGLSGGNNEIWMIHKTQDPRLFNQMVEHFENRLKDKQTRDLRVDFAKALAQSLVDPRGSRRAIEYLHADAVGNRLADRLTADPTPDFEAWISGQITLEDLLNRVLKLTNLRVRPQSLLMLSAFKAMGSSQSLFDLINFADVLLVKASQASEVTFFLEKALSDSQQRKVFRKIAEISQLPLAAQADAVMALIDSKQLKLDGADRELIRRENLLALGQRKLIEDSLRAQTADAVSSKKRPQSACRDKVKSAGRGKKK